MDTEALWTAAAEKAIGGSIGALTRKTVDGLAIHPLYPRRTEDAPDLWRPSGPWTVAQRVDHPDPDQANRLALLDLEGGADALTLVGARSPYARGFGLDEGGDLDVTLAGVELDFISLRLDAGPGTPALLAALAALVERRRLTSAALAIDIGFDPIGWSARLGIPVADDPRDLLACRADAGLAGTAFLADGRPWHEAGAGEAQELAAVLATAVAYLRLQDGHGIPLDVARKNVGLMLATDADGVLGLAKVRALRRLWARVETASGLAPHPARLHAETSWRMMTRYDPWSNVMRTTSATVAGGLGGADVVTVLPFTLPLGLPDDGARRLARNAQLMLLEESHLAAVDDPAAGAGGLEALTEALCAEAWCVFQAIERDGGLPRAIPRLAARIAESARVRAGDVATLTRGIVGTTRFASLDGPAVTLLDGSPRVTPEPGPDALPARRDAEPFESLRDRAEALASEGKRPTVFLATVGPPAAFGPHATRAANFFAAAGIVAQAPVEERTLAAQIEAFTGGGSTLVCVCGATAEEADRVAQGFRDAGATRVLLWGGRKVDGRSHVDGIIIEGCDALAILGASLR